jgi:hypothetical protein
MARDARIKRQAMEKEQCMEEIRGHLSMIEHSYGIRIVNPGEVTGWIYADTTDSRRILTIALSLNHWVAVNRKTGEVRIPRTVFDQIVKTIR